MSARPAGICSDKVNDLLQLVAVQQFISGGVQQNLQLEADVVKLFLGFFFWTESKYAEKQNKVTKQEVNIWRRPT